MVKRTSLEGADCPIARSLDAIGDWWSLLIIRDALLGRRRFGEFQKGLGLAKNILAARLRTLVDRGILETAPASDGSVYQEACLSDWLAKAPRHLLANNFGMPQSARRLRQPAGRYAFMMRRSGKLLEACEEYGPSTRHQQS